ncbi:MAG: IS3 family transposase, partial [Ruminococcus sp.]|nr:IS3 family transposase [Ruminococcus sp.]
DWDAPYEDDLEVIPSSCACGCEDEINAAIEKYSELEEKHRGLMIYYNEDSPVNEKVISAFPSVEVRNGELVGVLTCQITEPLTDAEMAEFKDWWTGQASDGWGEGYEQQEIKTDASGYYRWLKNLNKLTKQQLLLVEINAILAEHEDNDNYGVRRMHTALWQHGVQVSIRTLYRAMKTAGLLHKKRTPYGITKANTEAQERENLIKQDFHADEPLKKLLTDITEVPCMDGKLYVSPIMDCFNGESVA